MGLTVDLRKEQDKIAIGDLFYYFDAKERDRLDAGGVGRKQSTYLAMREKLLKLPDAQFDAAMKAIDALVGPGTNSALTTAEASMKGRAALELFERANASLKVSPSEKISRV